MYFDMTVINNPYFSKTISVGIRIPKSNNDCYEYKIATKFENGISEEWLNFLLLLNKLHQLVLHFQFFVACL